MSPLYPDVLACLSIQVLEIKKMVYLFLVNYSRVKPEMVKHALPGLLAVRRRISLVEPLRLTATAPQDANDQNALIRALALRTMSYIPVPEVLQALVEPLRHCLKDRDPYVRKTAAICVAKMYMHDRRIVEREHFVTALRDLLMDPNPTVIANAIAALTEISERSDNIHLRLNSEITRRLVQAMGEASECAEFPGTPLNASDLSSRTDGARHTSSNRSCTTCPKNTKTPNCSPSRSPSGYSTRTRLSFSRQSRSSFTS